MLKFQHLVCFRPKKRQTIHMSTKLGKIGQIFIMIILLVNPFLKFILKFKTEILFMEYVRIISSKQ